MLETSLRRRRLASLLPKTKGTGFVVTNLKNIRYLTGQRLSAGTLIIRRDSSTLCVNLQFDSVDEATAGTSLRIEDSAAFPRLLGELSVIFFEADDISVSRLAGWQKACKNKKFMPMTDRVEYLRRTKSPEELASIRAACSITTKVLREIPTMLKYGRSEKDIAWMIRGRCRDLGADAMAFETIVAIGENTSRPHWRPGERKLRKGDIVQIDMGAAYDGYCSDYSRVFFKGDPTPEQAKAYRALKKTKKAAEAMLRPRVTNRELDSEARRVLGEYGYDKEFYHALGHGVGMDIHEGVTISSKAKRTTLLRNEVITIEPGLYFPGLFGMRIEDTVVVR